MTADESGAAGNEILRHDNSSSEPNFLKKSFDSVKEVFLNGVHSRKKVFAKMVATPQR